MKVDTKVLTGQTQDHIEFLASGKIGVHREVITPLQRLKKAAKQAGFELEVCSGFRNFESQLGIWNAKVKGLRPVLDSQSRPIDISKLSPREIIFSILRWSALPGLSRHHWGTDLDVFDRRAMPQNYQLQLIPSEFEGKGFSAPLHDWLDSNLSKFGFFRPYAKDLGGVSPERWHISYQFLAEKFWMELTLERIEDVLKCSNIELKSEIIQNLPQIYEQFYARISTP